MSAMTADVLRQAATEMRREPDEFHGAVADWIDTILVRDPNALSVEAEPALTVARTYLGYA